MDFYFKRFAFLLFFLVSSLSLFSQNHKIDSLKRELRLHLDKDTLRVNILNDLAYAHFKKDKEKTFSYLEEAETMATALGYKKGKAKSLYLRGATQAVRSNFDKGLLYFNESLDLYKTIDFKSGIAKCYNGIGLLFSNKGDQKKAIDNYTASTRIYEKMGDLKAYAMGLNNIGRAYSDLGNNNQAITYYKKVLKIGRQLNDRKIISNGLNSIGTVYTEQGNYPLALEFYSNSLSIDEQRKDTLGITKSLNNIGIIHKKNRNYDKAILYYEKALKIQEAYGDKKNIAELLNNLGLVYKWKKNFEKAHKFLNEALTVSKEIKNKIFIATCLNNIGDVYLQQTENDKAFQYFVRAKNNNLEIENQLGLCKSYLGIATVYTNQGKYDKALANALKSKEISEQVKFLDYKRDVFELFSKIYNRTGNYKKAFESHQQYKILNDSLFNKENIEKITQLEYEYKYKQALDSASIRELQLTKKVTATNQDLVKSQRNYLWAIIGVLLVSILLGSIIFFQKFKNIKTQNENIAIEQKLLRSQMTPHFIFNSLSVLQGMMLNKEDEKSVSYLLKFSKLLRLTLENSRDKTVLLSEEMAAIENYLALQSLENKAFFHSIIVEDAIDTTSLKIPPMLIQPFIENAVEHAFVNQSENQKIAVHLKKNDIKLICTITDNGIGIDSQKRNTQKHKKSLATTITSERLQLLAEDLKMKGSVTVEDRKKYHEKGTLVTLVIPYITIV